MDEKGHWMKLTISTHKNVFFCRQTTVSSNYPIETEIKFNLTLILSER